MIFFTTSFEVTLSNFQSILLIMHRSFLTFQVIRFGSKTNAIMSANFCANFYEVLGIDQKTSETDIRKAYKDFALKFHPDKNNDAGTEEKFKLILEAYNVLNDPVQRAKFDQKLNDYKLKCTMCYSIFELYADLTNHQRKCHPKRFKRCTYGYAYSLYANSEELIEDVSNFQQFKTTSGQPTSGSGESTSGSGESTSGSGEDVLYPTQDNPKESKISAKNVGKNSNANSTSSKDSESNQSNPFKCSFCKASFAKSGNLLTEIKDLLEHQKQFHPLNCPWCDVSFAKSEDLDQHKEIYHLFKCDLCPLWYSIRLDNLIKHKIKEHPPTTFQCAFCHVSFARLEDMNQHKTEFHPIPFKCTQHISSAHEFRCEKCKKWFCISRTGQIKVSQIMLILIRRICNACKN